MKKLLIGLLALGSLSTFAVEQAELQAINEVLINKSNKGEVVYSIESIKGTSVGGNKEYVLEVSLINSQESYGEVCIVALGSKAVVSCN